MIWKRYKGKDHVGLGLKESAWKRYYYTMVQEGDSIHISEIYEEKIRPGIYFQGFPTPVLHPRITIKEFKAFCLRVETKFKGQGLIPTYLLAPEEEPDWCIRLEAAERIAVDRIDHLLTPAEEPDWHTRRMIARRIAVELLTHPLTLTEEPDNGIRWEVIDRIAIKYLTRPLIPAEEPDKVNRQMVINRIAKKSQKPKKPKQDATSKVAKERD